MRQLLSIIRNQDKFPSNWCQDVRKRQVAAGVNDPVDLRRAGGIAPKSVCFAVSDADVTLVTANGTRFYVCRTAHAKLFQSGGLRLDGGCRAGAAHGHRDAAVYGPAMARVGSRPVLGVGFCDTWFPTRTSEAKQRKKTSADPALLCIRRLRN